MEKTLVKMNVVRSGRYLFIEYKGISAAVYLRGLAARDLVEKQLKDEKASLDVECEDNERVVEGKNLKWKSYHFLVEGCRCEIEKKKSESAIMLIAAAFKELYE